MSAARSHRLPGASEETTHRAVVAHLAARARPDVFYFHPANGGPRHKATGGQFRALGVVAGVPDLVLVIEGKFFGLELKRAHGGRLSAPQTAAHARIQAAGGTVATAHGLDEALAVLGEWGVWKQEARSPGSQSGATGKHK